MSKLDKSKMTSEQRMQYEMMMAKNATIIEMLKEEERKKLIRETAKRTAERTAKEMKKNGESIENIIKYTGLKKAEIENL